MVPKVCMQYGEKGGGAGEGVEDSLIVWANNLLGSGSTGQGL